MTDNEIRDTAVEYVARHEHDNCQIFTDPDCRIKSWNLGDWTTVQVWVAMRRPIAPPNIKRTP